MIAVLRDLFLLMCYIVILHVLMCVCVCMYHTTYSNKNAAKKSNIFLYTLGGTLFVKCRRQLWMAPNLNPDPNLLK